jgi:proline iminopeptidase
MMEYSVVATAGSRLTVRQSKATGEPLLMLHGGPGVPDSMQSAIAPLLPEMRCISFDQRGVGASECLDGRYDLSAYVDDIEAVRSDLGVADWHVLGHSWGGLLGQVYTARCPQVVRSLALSSSSLGVGNDWKYTKREAFRTDRARAGLWGTLRFLTYGAGIYLPGPLRAPAMRHVMTETWHNYFLDPHSAPDPDPEWLAGCSAEAMLKTDRALTKQKPEVLDGLRDYAGPALVLYGASDIFGTATDIVRARFPKALQVTLADSGHLHWLQNRSAYSQTLQAFHGQLRTAAG